MDEWKSASALPISRSPRAASRRLSSASDDMKPDEEHAVRCKEVLEALEPAGAIEDMLDDDVVSRVRERRNRAVEALEERRAEIAPVKVAAL